MVDCFFKLAPVISYQKVYWCLEYMYFFLIQAKNKIYCKNYNANKKQREEDMLKLRDSLVVENHQLKERKEKMEKELNELFAVFQHYLHF